MSTAPVFNDSGMVGVPINAVLDGPMGTKAGNTAFLNPKVNTMFKKMLDEWARFLETMRYAARRSGKWKFENEYICDPKAPHYGFRSWDDFFIKRFRDGVRPVAHKDDDNVIVNACESAPYATSRNVKAMDQFWIKEQPYILKHMLNHDPLAMRFVGGTVYQAFLSATSYHRWNTTISGKIVKTVMAPGTYFLESQVYDWPHLDPDAPDSSQGYIAAAATRALLFIEADNPKIGLMCIIFIGIADVSTCDIQVYEGQHVTKGEEIGMLHFGGSTYCLVFRPDVKLDFDLHGQEKRTGITADNIQLNKGLATVPEDQELIQTGSLVFREPLQTPKSV